MKVYDKEIKPGIQARLWTCHHCNDNHLIMVMDKKSRRMMKENREDRERIGGINRKSQQLKKQNKFTSEQAQDALKRMEEVEECINERTSKLDIYTKRLINEYKEEV